MRILVIWTITLASFEGMAQRGFVKMTNDSILTGYIRPYSKPTGERGYEVWKTKTDKNPIQIPRARIRKFCIKKDTFLVLNQYRPLQDERFYVRSLDIKPIEKGKVNLYRLEYTNSGVVETDDVGIDVRIVYTIYILEDPKTEAYTAVPADEELMTETLLNFFPEEFIFEHQREHGRIYYRELPELVRLFNAGI
jgi:hypothetical protein